MPGSFSKSALRGLITAAILAAVLAAGPSGADAKPAQAAKPRLTTSPTVFPAFSWKKRDYVVRCARSKNPRARIVVPRGWQARIAGSTFHARNFSHKLNSGESAGTWFSVRRKGSRKSRSFHIRCLPADFPAFRFSRYRSGGPRLMFAQIENEYAVFFDRHGVPVWWMKNVVPPLNPQVLPDGTISYLSLDTTGPRNLVSYVIRNLNGRLIRTILPAGGLLTDAHELRLLPNGNYLIGAFRQQNALDASAFGGSSHAVALSLQLQQLKPNGKLVWKWNSTGHIKLGESGRWWNNFTTNGEPYDLVHFNSADLDGNSLVMSFRHLDAVIKVSKKTGKIVWKLGGTNTPKNLKVLGDPLRTYPFGGQHDARLDNRGYLSVFDNGTNLNRPPRVVRYRIDQKTGTATLVSSFTDPRVQLSACCGSARRLPGGGWLVNWGGIGPTSDYGHYGLIGAYTGKGKPIFRLRVKGTHPYRVQPITGRYPQLGRLRNGMDTIDRNS
ncbi:MAG: aryl-sulfate sulfotransferase [Solirubrobacterales bacterium]|nr:aryl-sulfate sulfotransferase [Solirubrobacterales bacterium]